MDTLISVLPIFLIVVVGFVLRKQNIAKNQWITVLNGFVYYVALPALIIKNISLLDWSSAEVVQVVGWNVGFLIVASIILILLLSVLHINKPQKAAIFLTAVVSNSVYLGFPLISRALNFSGGSPEYSMMSLVGVVQLVAGMVIALVVIEFIYTDSKNISKIAKHMAKNPLVIASVVGIFLSTIAVPDNLENVTNDTLSLLAVTASPVALFALGAFLSGHKIKEKMNSIGIAVGLKLVLLPGIAYVMFTNLVFVGDTTRLSTILLASMPTAVTAFVLAESYKLDTAFVAVTMLISTILSLPLLTVLVSMLNA